MRAMKKITMLAISLSLVMGFFVPRIMVHAEEPLLQTQDFSDTTLQRDEKELEVDNKEVGNLEDFNVSPLYDVENNELLLPRMDGYTIEVFGSDNKATISLNGEVTRPLVTQTVKLLYTIKNKDDGSVVTTQKNATIKIPAKETSVIGSNAKPQIIPGLREWVGGNGVINLNNARIVLGQQSFSSAATTFQADYEELTGRTITVVHGNKANLQAGDIYIGEAVDDKMIGDEGYYMNIGGSNANQNFIEIEAIHNTGALYGTITLLQILKQEAGRNDVPRGLVKDYPLFEQRGMMLDVARKWIPMEYLKDLAKQMSWYKLNMLAVHLSDNDIWNSLSTDGGTAPEGWFRLENETFPGLTSADHYTKEEFRNFQYSSMDLGIDVIPELDTPGHALAYTEVWPELALPGNGKYLDVTNPKVIENVKKIFDEYIDGFNGGKPTFVNEYVNIGTDEYKVSGQVYKEAFRQYCNDLIEYVNSKGKKSVFWGSLRENAGTTPVSTDALMFAWFQGYANVKESLDAGYHVISMEDQEVYIVPGGGYYSQEFGQAEYLYNNWLPNNNRGWAGNPAPDGHPRVNGGQFAVWNDFHGNGISVNDISYRIQHNLYAIATKCWSGNQMKTEGNDFKAMQKLASVLGDAPNADFMYDVDKTLHNDELIKIDATLTNQVAMQTGAAILENKNIEENVTGKNGQAIQFNGGESYFTTDLTSNGFDWTTSMWINPQEDGVLMEGKTGTLYLENGQIKYDVENYTHSFAHKVNMKEWTHIALTGTYQGVSLYVNGALVDSLIGKPYPNYNINSNSDFGAGSYPVNQDGVRTQRYHETLMLPMETIGSKTNAMIAAVDELNIYNRVLNEAEIKALAQVAVYANVALHKEVEILNQYGSNIGKNAVDGDIDSRWEFNLNDTGTNYITIPLAKDEDVSSVVVKQRVWGNGPNRIKDIKIVAVSGDNETAIIDTRSFDEGVLNGDQTIRTSHYDLHQTVKADALKIYLTPLAAGADDLVNIREIELYGSKILVDDLPKQNVALNKNVTVDSYHSASTEGDRSGLKAVDGDLESRWEFDLNNTSTNSITIPLITDEDVNQIIIKQMVWAGVNRIKDIRISLLKGASEIELLSKASYDPGTIDANAKIATRIIHLDSAVEGDAIKIYMTPLAAGADDLVNIREIEMYGNKVEEDQPVQPEEPTIRNDKLIPQSSMKAFATSEHPDVGVEGLASMAIDGNPGTWWHTNWSVPVPLPQSITIDLQDIKMVGKYTYLPRNNGSNGNITQYQLEGSTDNVTYELIHEGSWADNAELKTIAFAPRGIRYMKLTAKQGVGGFANAAELNVYQSDVVSKDELQTIVDSLSKITLDTYLKDSTKTFTAALEMANSLLKEAEITAEQLIKISESLHQGLSVLDLVGEKKALEEVYNTYIDFDSSNYVQSSFEAFSAQLIKIKAAIDGNAELGKKEINKFITDIKEKAQALVDLRILRTIINTADEIDVLDLSEDSAKELVLRLNNAKEVEQNKAASENQVLIAAYRLGVAIAEIQPDASALQQLIDSFVEADYTDASWAQFEKTLVSVSNLLETEYTVADLTAARETIRTAALKLVKKPLEVVDKTSLQTLFDQVSKLDQNNYTSTSWATLKAKLDDTRAILANVDATQTEVDEAKLALTEAKAELVKRGDKTALQTLFDEASNLVEKDYTIATWATFKEVYDEAKGLLDNADATQEAVNTMITRLNAAINELEEVTGIDKSMLIVQIEKAEAMIANKDKYVAESIKGLEAMIANAKAVYENTEASQEAVNTATTSLIAAIEKAEMKVNKESLQALLEKVKAMDVSKYTEASVEVLKAAIANAEKVMKDENATQAQVEMSMKVIQTAMDGLKKKPTNGNVSGGGANTGDTTNSAVFILLMGFAGAMALYTKRKGRFNA